MPLVQIETNDKKPRWWRSPIVWRHGVMLFFFVFLLRVAYHHNVKGGGPRGEPSVEAYCPFGGLENLYQFLTTGGYIHRIEPSAMVLMAAVFLLTLFFSRGFCGWICPFGSLQEWIAVLGRKVLGKRFNPTGVWERRLRHLKYVILAVIISLTWYLGALIFRDYDPFLAFFHLGQNIGELPWAYSILGVVLLGSFFIERFFCKYACPLGAVIGLLGKAGLTSLQRDESGCKGCNICQKRCYAHIDFLSTTKINDLECNHCMDCVVHCPKPNVLTVRTFKWRFNHPVYASFLLAGLFSIIFASKAAALWRTKPATVAFTNAAGKLDPGQIRGWMTLKEVSDGYRIPLADLYQRAGLPSHVNPDTRLNQVARNYNLEFEPESVRELVGQTAPPKKTETKDAAKGESKGGSTKQGHEGEELRGMMTLNEIVMKSGVPKDWLLKRLKVTGEINPRVPVREWLHDKGMSMQEVRQAVADYRAGKR